MRYALSWLAGMCISTMVSVRHLPGWSTGASGSRESLPSSRKFSAPSACTGGRSAIPANGSVRFRFELTPLSQPYVITAPRPTTRSRASVTTRVIRPHRGLSRFLLVYAGRGGGEIGRRGSTVGEALAGPLATGGLAGLGPTGPAGGG